VTTGTVSRTLKCSCGHIFVVQSRKGLKHFGPFAVALASNIIEVQDVAAAAFVSHLATQCEKHQKAALAIQKGGTMALPVIADLVIAAYLRVPGNQRPHGDTP